ncbi:hypothetical protein K1719_012428 [Acacia pycnantha]|nr:hypothetical protein K1719_012428 [Acacia pycnantha]
MSLVNPNCSLKPLQSSIKHRLIAVFFDQFAIFIFKSSEATELDRGKDEVLEMVGRALVVLQIPPSLQ